MPSWLNRTAIKVSVIPGTVRFLVLACLFHVPVGTHAEPVWNDITAEKLDERLSGLMQDNDVVGMAIGVLVNRELVFASGYGLRRLGDEGLITERSVFHWASVSKPFVATAIMQLVEEDQLALDDRLGAVLPYFRMADERYQQITIQQLLVHTSGMPDVDDYEWDKPQFDDEALKRWAMQWSPAWTDPEDPSRQAGLGWNVGRRWGGLLIASHGGHDDGFRSFLAITPDEGAAVFVASNDDNAPVGPFVLAALAVLFPEQAAVEAAKDGS